MNSHTQRQWEGKFFRCQMMCWYCRVPLTLKEATKDHLTPLSRGGQDLISNIVPACIECNRLKGAHTEEEFRAERAHLLTISRFSKAMPFTPEQKPSGARETQAGLGKLSLAQRDEPPLAALRREAEGGCPLAFKSRL